MKRLILPLFAFLVCAPALAHAQDFGVLESAETINRGNFKLRANPVLIFGKSGEDSEVGVAVLGGYGFTRRFDAEGALAFYDGWTFFGGNAEVWLLERRPFDFSVSAGLHGRRGNRATNGTGIDLTFLPSKHITPKLDIYGALDFAFEKVQERFGDDYKTVHLVPGIEYKLSPDLDFVAELGIALNDDARHYLSGGVAYYLR